MIQTLGSGWKRAGLWSRPDPVRQEALAGSPRSKRHPSHPGAKAPQRSASRGRVCRVPLRPAPQDLAVSLSSHCEAWGAWSLQLARSLPVSSRAFPGASLGEGAAET